VHAGGFGRGRVSSAQGNRAAGEDSRETLLVGAPF
jgi:hypothetical protein